MIVIVFRHGPLHACICLAHQGLVTSLFPAVNYSSVAICHLYSRVADLPARMCHLTLNDNRPNGLGSQVFE